MGCNKNAIHVRVSPWNKSSTRTMYEQYYALCFFFNNLVWVYFQFSPPCSALLIDPVAVKRKFYNIIQCKVILDPPFHYNNGCTFKWFLEYNNELVCIQTLMPIFPGKIFHKTWYTSKHPLKTAIIYGVVYLPNLKDHHHITLHGLSLAKLNSFPDHSLELTAPIRILWHI